MEKKETYDLVVIGGGAAGLVAAYTAAAAKARVALIERDRMGGDCLNTGCVPSKALIRAARLAADARKASELGLGTWSARTDFARVMESVQKAIMRVAPHDSVERYEGLGVECIPGEAKVLSPVRVAVGGRILVTRALVLAMGAAPSIPSIPGLSDCSPLTSENLWSLRELPAKLLVLGGGPIGCELSQALARLGAEVTLIERSARLLPREDEEAAALVHRSLERDGVKVLVGTEAKEFRPGFARAIGPAGGENELVFDRVLVALGRAPRTQGLESLNLRLREDGTVFTNAYLETSVPGVFACGDVAGPFQLTHFAGHQGWHAAMNALLRPLWKIECRTGVIPRALFTDPEVAAVGSGKEVLARDKVDFEETRFGLEELDRAISDGLNEGFVRVLTKKGSDQVLGATIVGPHASDLIAEVALAMRNGLGLKAILRTVHAYPTYPEALRYAAGEWQKKRIPKILLSLSARLNALRRPRGHA